MYVKNVIDTNHKRKEVNFMKQSDVIKIFVTSSKKKSKDGKRKWLQFRTKMLLTVKGEEQNGKVAKWVNLTFCGKEMSEYANKHITRGYLHVKVSDIQYPKVYEITEDENGKKSYPEVKLFGFEEFREVLKDVENPFITDEKETEETEIEETESEVADEVVDTGDNFESEE